MKRFRVSIAGIMGVVIYVAIAVTALKYSSLVWAYIIFEMTISLLCLSVLCAAFTLGNKRRFWAGFAVFGWGNLLGFVIYSGFDLDKLIDKFVANTNMISVLNMKTLVPDNFYLIFCCVVITTLAYGGGILSRILFRVDAAPAEG